MLAAAVEVGRVLQQAREQCRHGEWGDYLRQHYPGSEREAQRYMRLAREYRDAADIPPDMSLRQALALLTRSRGPCREQREYERIGRDTLETLLPQIDAVCEAAETIIRALREAAIGDDHRAAELTREMAKRAEALSEYLHRDNYRHLAEEAAALRAVAAETAAESRELRVVG
jgi:hypothetical protein